MQVRQQLDRQPHHLVEPIVVSPVPGFRDIHEPDVGEMSHGAILANSMRKTFTRVN